MNKASIITKFRSILNTIDLSKTQKCELVSILESVLESKEENVAVTESIDYLDKDDNIDDVIKTVNKIIINLETAGVVSKNLKVMGRPNQGNGTAGPKKPDDPKTPTDDDKPKDGEKGTEKR